MPWHPPIPSEAVYSIEVAQLGAGLRLLWYLYNKVQRDSTVEFSPRVASESLSVPYDTVRNWWQALRPLGIVTVEQDRGKKGYVLRFDDDWIDWHVMAANYPGAAPVQRSNMTTETVERPVNGFSMDFQRSNIPVEEPAYKVLMDYHESPPPPPTESQPPRANAAIAVGGGGGRWRSHPVYQLFVQPKYGILSADRLMPDWQDAPPDQVQKLLERLYAQHYSANAPNQVAGRMYRALQAGPGALLKPPARAAPAPAAAPAVPVPRTDTRAIAAIFLEGRNGKSNAD